MSDGPADDSQPRTSTPRNSNTSSPQEEDGRQRQSQTSCKARRSQTCEDETPVNIQSPPGTPGSSLPPLRRCELAGVAIVRRRIDFDSSSSKNDTTDGEEKPPEEGQAEAGDKAEEDADEAEKDKAEEAEEPKAGESSSPTPEKDKNGEKPANGNGATPAPCPGLSDPTKDCTCPTKTPPPR